MPKPRPLRTAADREARRIRIVAAIRNGVSYDAIARRETISRERVLSRLHQLAGIFAILGGGSSAISN